MRVRVAAVAVVVVACASPARGETEVRVATYNIKFLKASVDAVRRDRIKSVIEKLDADVIALQEIEDRTALEAVFDKTAWHLVVDDDSGDDQDVALAVRKPWKLPQFSGDLDADTEHFLFPDAPADFFPDKRYVLAVRVQSPDGSVEFTVLVVHARSRYGGRAVTDGRRIEATRMLVEKIRAEFDDVPLVLLGNFNDNPDDQSLNILETGNPSAARAPTARRTPSC